MSKCFLLGALSLALFACDRQEPNPAKGQEFEKVEKNAGDRDSKAIPSMDQGKTENDRSINQKIRQAIMSDPSLSNKVQNIKIETDNGAVTLSGSVGNQKEKNSILRKVNETPGIVKIVNHLEIQKINKSEK